MGGGEAFATAKVDAASKVAVRFDRGPAIAAFEIWSAVGAGRLVVEVDSTDARQMDGDRAVWAEPDLLLGVVDGGGGSVPGAQREVADAWAPTVAHLEVDRVPVRSGEVDDRESRG